MITIKLKSAENMLLSLLENDFKLLAKGAVMKDGEEYSMWTLSRHAGQEIEGCEAVEGGYQKGKRFFNNCLVEEWG